MEAVRSIYDESKTVKWQSFKDWALLLLLSGLLAMHAWSLQQIADLKAQQNFTNGQLTVIEKILKIP
jgi:hypothetical protein